MGRVYIVGKVVKIKGLG